MATLTESIGNYELAVKYASLRYYYTKNCDDLARCFDDSVLLGKDEYVLQYGEQLINSGRDYEEVCKNKNTVQTGSGYDYDHWVKGKLAVSYYNLGKKDEAIKMASEDNGTKSFAYGNALMSLAARIRTEKDADTADKLLKVLEEIDKYFENNPPSDKKERENLTKVITAMRTVKQSAINQG